MVTFKITPGGREAFQVINVRHGKIVHMQGVRSRREAMELAGIPEGGA